MGLVVPTEYREAFVRRRSRALPHLRRGWSVRMEESRFADRDQRQERARTCRHDR
jgi:hypothetical protein